MGISLTRQQAKVAIMLGRGFSYGEIAEELGTARKTVKQYLWRARRRVGAKTFPQLAVMVALRRGRQ